MREGQYEMILLDEKDKPFPEIYLNNEWIIQAQPNASYHVQINIYRDTNGFFPHKYIRLGLFIDGDDVQYWKRLDFSDEKKLPKDRNIPVSSIFWGFKKNISEIRSFVFASPAVINPNETLPNRNSSSSSPPPLPSSVNVKKDLGTIRLVVHDAKVTFGTFANNTGVHEIPTNSSKAISENEKFWKQASVVTTSGKRVNSEKEKFLPLERWENCSTIPIFTMKIQYHQEEMIQFLKNPNLNLNLKRKRENSFNEGEENENDHQHRKEGRKEGEESLSPFKQEEEEETGNHDEIAFKEVVEIVKEKEVPLLDLSTDSAVWSTVKLKR